MIKKICLILSIIVFTTALVACNHSLNQNTNELQNSDNENNARQTVWDGTIAKAFESGNGSDNDPYKIATPAQLAYLAKQVNEGISYSGCHFVLANNLDLNNIEWTPIGNGINYFAGYFDGNDKTIKNLKITSGALFNYQFPTGRETTYFVSGLFATIQDAEIKNLSINNAEIIASIPNDAKTVRLGILCGVLQTYESTSVISNIKIQNSKITPLIQSTKTTNNLTIGGAIGNVYLTENTTTTINVLETDTSIIIEDNHAEYNEVGSAIGSVAINNSTFNIENCNSYMNLIINKEQCYTTHNYFGAIGVATVTSEAFSMENVFSKLSINKICDNSHGYMAYTANAIIGDTYYVTSLNVPNSVGYKFKNVFGCIEQIDDTTNQKLILTNLYDLPDGHDFYQDNCIGCESLPENHKFDKNIWDLSNLSAPKIK